MAKFWGAGVTSSSDGQHFTAGGMGEAMNLQQQIGDPGLRHVAIERQHQVFGAVGHGLLQAVDMQLPAVDGACRQLSLIDCPSHAIQLVPEGFGSGVKPEATIHGHGQSRRGNRRSGNQGGVSGT